MEGGMREVSLKLTFMVDPPSPEMAEWSAIGIFHDADIQVDAILSYPWLEQAKLGVFPHLGALVSLPPLGDPIHLKGWPKKGKRRPRKPRIETQTPTEGPEGLYGSVHLSDLARKCQEDEEHLARVTQARAMNLVVPSEVGELEDPLFEDEDVLEYLVPHLMDVTPNSVWGVITVPEGQTSDDRKVKELIEAIRRDFDGTVLRDNVPPENLIPRGPHGEGHIKIKPGYIAKTQRPIHLVGERRDALIELVQGWMRDGKVENGCGEWSSPEFVVAKEAMNGGAWWIFKR